MRDLDQVPTAFSLLTDAQFTRPTWNSALQLDELFYRKNVLHKNLYTFGPKGLSQKKYNCDL